MALQLLDVIAGLHAHGLHDPGKAQLQDVPDPLGPLGRVPVAPFREGLPDLIAGKQAQVLR